MNIKNKEIKKDNRELCKYGKDCYQKNPFHLAKFRHLKRPSDDTTSGIDKKNKLEATTSKLSGKDDNKETKDMKDPGSKDDYSNLHFVSDSSSDENIVDEVYKLNETVNINDDQSTEDMIIVNKLAGDDKNKLRQLYVVEFPDDFFNFYEYCKSIYSKSPKTALRDVDIELVGPFDYLSGDIKSCRHSDIVKHYRYYFDPPEFYTVLKCNSSELHYGYYFDDPDKPPAFVCSNDPSKNCIIEVQGQTIFGAANSHINTVLQTSDPFKKLKIQKIQKTLIKWAKDNKFTVETNSLAIRARNSKVNTKTFHTAGIVVPYDPKTDVGYRPLAENDKTMKDLLKQIKESDSESVRNKKWEKIQHVLTFASIAADECDFGTALELGIDMFCQGHECFDRPIIQFMSMAYNLLNRHHFADVINIHLKNRLKGSNLNFAARKNLHYQ